jgi:transcriptional regulator with XRE-family HTH domain
MIDIDTVVTHRLRRGISQRTLATRIGVDPLTVHRLERGDDPGDLSLRVAARLADEIGLTLPQILTVQAVRTTTPDPSRSHALRHDHARLLHRIHTTGRVPRSLSAMDRTITLPALINAGLVQVTDGVAHLHPDVLHALNP